MKTIITLLLLSTIAMLHTHGQPIFKNTLASENIKGKVTMITETTYKVPGAPAKPKDYSINTGVGKAVTYFDKKGNITEIYRYKTDGSLSNKVTQTYNDKSQLIKGDNYRPDGSIGTTYSIKYDNKGNIIEKTSNFYGLGYRITESYIYNSEGSLSEENSLMEYYTEPGTSKIKTIYKFMNAGKEVESIDYIRGEAGMKTIKKFNNNHQLIEEKSYSERLGGIPSGKETYRYDNHGNLIEKQDTSFHRGEVDKIVRSTYEYEYDKSGNWTKKRIFENDNPVAIAERTIQYR